MINKLVDSMAQAIQGIKDGDVLLIGGFGTSGRPAELLAGVFDLGVKDLTSAFVQVLLASVVSLREQPPVPS